MKYKCEECRRIFERPAEQLTMDQGAVARICPYCASEAYKRKKIKPVQYNLFKEAI